MALQLQGRPTGPQTVVLVLAASLLIAGVVLGARAVLQWSTTHELADDSMTERMMEKKSRQLQRVLDGMIEHDYAKVSDAVTEIERISERMEWFIAAKEYDEDRQAFRDSLDSLQAAVDANNSQAAIASADRLVDSCMQCHEHLTQDRLQP